MSEIEVTNNNVEVENQEKTESLPEVQPQQETQQEPEQQINGSEEVEVSNNNNNVEVENQEKTDETHNNEAAGEEGSQSDDEVDDGTGISLNTTQVSSEENSESHQATPRPNSESANVHNEPEQIPAVKADLKETGDELKRSPSGFKDEWLDQLKTGKYLNFEDLKELCSIIKDILIDESNVRNVSSPVTICGDVHGQFEDVMELFRQGGELPDTSYIFMGDFVDRGYFSLETFSLLMASKAKWPDRVTLLRGNHETRQITQVYGFYDECMQKYNDAAAWRMCVQVFDLLNTAAVVDGKIFCVHGGLSPAITEVDQIRTIIRNIEVPAEGPLCDLLWSDPEEIENYQPSPRGGGCLFGRAVTHEFLWLNELDIMARAHQLIQDGYAYMFDKKLVTVWSAPNYCYRCGNVASIMQVDSNLNHNFKIFNAVPDEQRMPAPKQQQTRYFL